MAISLLFQEKVAKGRMRSCEEGPGVRSIAAILLICSIVFYSDLSAQKKQSGGKSVDSPASISGVYKNTLLDAGYSKADIDKKLAKAYYDVFEGPNHVYFEVGDTMGYVSDVKNHDARTEGLSYGMMIAVQLNKKQVFDRIWRWSKKYLQHQDGPREGYFAWSINPQTMKKNSEGSASDGELYYITDLLFAANKWGNNTGIDYYGEARRILDAMWKKDGTGNVFNLINTEHKQITFVPEGGSYNWTDPSYHLPALNQLIKNGTNVLIADTGGPKLHLWRASHRNDDDWAYNMWQKFGVNSLQYQLVDFKVESVDNTSVKITSTTKADGKEGFGVYHTATYLVKGDGSIKVDNKVQFIGFRINLARIGVRMLLDKKLDRMTFFGRGPYENYSDRKGAEDVGIYDLGVNEQYEYEKPMERGNHEEVRWAKLSGNNMPGFMVKSDENLMQVSALPHTDEQMYPVEYKIDLPASTATVLCISTKTLGVGSASCGPRPLEKFQVFADTTNFTYIINLSQQL